MSEKLLHERMRECAERCVDEIDVNGLSIGPFYPNELNVIADEIERCYAPLPRYEGGTPISKGCEIEGGVVSGWCIWDDGAFSLNNDEGEVIQEGDPGEFVKRPTPKVLDADGVEIKVGKTLYLITTGEPVTVEALENVEYMEVLDAKGDSWNAKFLTHEKPVFDADGERICKGDTVWRVEDGLKMKVRAVGEEALEKHWCSVATLLPNDRWDCYGVLHYSGKELTHREPDSLEKLRDDLMAAHESWDGDPNKLVGYADRITALIERGA